MRRATLHFIRLQCRDRNFSHKNFLTIANEPQPRAIAGTGLNSRQRANFCGVQPLTPQKLHRERTVVQLLQLFSATGVEAFQDMRATRHDVYLPFLAGIPAVW